MAFLQTDHATCRYPDIMWVVDQECLEQMCVGVMSRGVHGSTCCPPEELVESAVLSSTSQYLAQIAHMASDLVSDQDVLQRTSSDTSAGERWGKAKQNIRASVGFSRAFLTLRSMSGEIYIEPSQLQRVKKLGAGAFATVDKCWYTPADGGQKCLVAVKRLRPELFKEPAQFELFCKEVALMRKLRHR